MHILHPIRLSKLFCCCWIHYVLVIGNSFSQKKFTLEDGNNNIRIQCIAQHPNGALLIGTSTGMYEFGGIQFSKYTADTTISNHQVTAIGMGNNSEMWAGFANGDLAVINGKSFRALLFQEGRFNKAVTKIFTDKKNRVWCATAGEGVYYYENKKWYNCNADDGLSDNFVYDLLEVDGGILAATDAGVNMIALSDNKKSISAVTTRQGLTDNLTTCLRTLPDGNIMAGHQDKGFSIITVLAGKPLLVQKGNIDWDYGEVTGILTLNQEVYLSTSDSGLIQCIFHEGDYLLKRTDVPAGISKGFVDSSGLLWLAAGAQLQLSTFGHLKKIVPFIKEDDAAASHAISVGGDGRMWYALRNQLHSIATAAHPQKMQITLPLPAANTEITALFQDGAGIIWVGTMGNGIWLADPATGKLKQLKEIEKLQQANVLSISGRGEEIWISSLEGVFHCILHAPIANAGWPSYEMKNLADINTIGTSYIYQIFIDSKRRVWFATDGKGVTVLHKKDHTHFGEKEGLANQVVYSIAEDRNGRIWMNALNSGLYYYDGKKLQPFTTKNGLSSDAISVLQADKMGNIIALSAQAIDVINTKNMVVQSWDVQHGLSTINTDLHSLASTPNASVLFAAADGVYELNTAVDIKQPKAYIESVEIFLQKIEWQKVQAFESDQHNLGIHFNAIDFLHPDNVQFQYKLEGLGSNWIPTKDRYVNFPKLPPGNYTFQLRASSNGAFEQAPVVTYSFSIAKPFYQRVWFILLASAALASLIWTIIRFREKQQQHLQQVQQAHLQSQLETLKNQVSPHFFFNSLNTLMALIEDNRDAALAYTAHLSDFFRKIVQYRNEDTIGLKDELALVADYLFIQQQRFGAALEMHCNIEEGIIQHARIAPLTLQMLVENAIKHNAFTVAHPLIIHITAENDYLIVSNNLRPKLTREPGEGLGLQNIQHRYKLLTGKEIMIAQDNEVFAVSIPLPFKPNKPSL